MTDIFSLFHRHSRQREECAQTASALLAKKEEVVEWLYNLWKPYFAVEIQVSLIDGWLNSTGEIVYRIELESPRFLIILAHSPEILQYDFQHALDDAKDECYHIGHRVFANDIGHRVFANV